MSVRTTMVDVLSNVTTHMEVTVVPAEVVTNFILIKKHA